MKCGNATKYSVLLLALALLLCSCNTQPLAALPESSPVPVEALSGDEAAPLASQTAMPAQSDMPEKSTILIIPEDSTTPMPTPTATSEFSPEVTFVPIPKGTPVILPDGSTPSPTPPWVTPFPSPSGEPYITRPESVFMVTVTSDDDYVPVRHVPDRSSDPIGKAMSGSSYVLLEEQDYWYRVLFNGYDGYIRKSSASIEEVACAAKGELAYSIASWNVHNLGGGEHLDGAAGLIMESGADIVCLQEVDYLSARVNHRDMPLLISEAAGYPYYYYTPAIEYKGGFYGSLLLSRYPIIDAVNIPLEVSPGKEERTLGYAKILLEGGAVDVFFTHLCPSSMCFKSHNLCSLKYELARCGVPVYTISGDFNCSPPRIYDFLPELRFCNVTMNTCGDGTVPKILDNILYTEGIVPRNVHIVDAQSQGLSDHDLVYAEILVKEQQP